MRYTPPVYMRRVVPWWLLRLLDRRVLRGTCWIAMGSWKYGDDVSWWPSWSRCAGRDGLDYCTRYPARTELARPKA